MSATPPPPPPSSSSPSPAERFSTGVDETDEPLGIHGAAGIAPGGRTVPPPWKRIVARLVDWVIVYLVIGSLIGFLIVGEDITAEATDDVGAGASLAVGLLVLLVGFVWEVVTTKMTGGTPMKRVFKMRVVQADSGADVEWRHATIRWAALAVIAIVPFVGVIGQLVMVVVSLVFLFTKPLRRAVWDLAAKTVVVDG